MSAAGGEKRKTLKNGPFVGSVPQVFINVIGLLRAPDEYDTMYVGKGE